VGLRFEDDTSLWKQLPGGIAVLCTLIENKMVLSKMNWQIISWQHSGPLRPISGV